ncbi:hypothetical protein NMG60_11029918 [Bertholletia excelsa]
MDIVGPLINAIVLVSNSVSTRIVYFVNLNEKLRFLTDELQKLNAKRDDLKTQIDIAELKGLACTNQVKLWLQKFDSIQTEVSRITEDFAQSSRSFWKCSTSCTTRYKLSKKVQRELKEMNDMGIGPLDVLVANGPIPNIVEELPTRPSIGLEPMLEKVRQFLDEQDVGIIGIYGMGGVGKTTLLKYINNQLLRMSHDFDVVIWVVVSRDVVYARIQETIGGRLGLVWDKNESLEQRASNIYRVLRQKKFLLLDDVWEGLELEEIGIPLPAVKTNARWCSRHVPWMCAVTWAQRKIKVHFLTEEESRKLFHEKVGKSEIMNSPSINSHVETIIRKCGGLPLALVTVGRAMANKMTKEEWEDAIEVLNKSPSELGGMGNVFALLKFSFDNLKNDILKLCLLYCSLFPEGCSIEKEQLVEYWIGEGFLDCSHYGNAHNKGHAIIGSLKIACLLENGEEETQVKMHDVVRSFALWVASDFGQKRIISGVRYWEATHRISLLDNEITELSEIPSCPHLETLLLQWNRGLNKISDGFFQFMPSLRVLDLSFTSLKEIPSSICKLAELHHLDLSGTKLSTLPKELGCLTNLRHLDLQRTHYLRNIPREAISGLSQLRVLNLYYSYGCWEFRECENENEFQLADLENLKLLTSIGITVTELTTLEKLSGFISLLKCIQFLYITECEGLHYLKLPSDSSDAEKLRRLSINCCNDLKHLEIGPAAGKTWLSSLEVLALHSLPNMTQVWRNSSTQGCLQSLRSISIWYCHKLKNISWISSLPKLETVYLFYCNEMEELISGEGVIEEEGSVAFPLLRTMSIRDLPKLRSISRKAMYFPFLERLAVIGCPKLKKLPLKTSNASTLATVYGEQKWVDNLEWDEDAKSSIPHFIAT